MLKKKPSPGCPCSWPSVWLPPPACGDDKKDDADGTDNTSEDASAYADLTGSINGSGASFPDAFYQEAIDAFAEVSDLAVTYNAVGSGTGKKDFGGNLIDFAGTDSLVKDGDGPARPARSSTCPTVAAPITVSYNLDRCRRAAAQRRTRWPRSSRARSRRGTTPAIAADNPGADLPGKAIAWSTAPTARAPPATSPSTSAAAARTLDAGHRRHRRMAGRHPGRREEHRRGPAHQGTATAPSATSTSPTPRPRGLTFAAIKNKDGKFVAADARGRHGRARRRRGQGRPDLRPADAAGADAYPITAPTYILVHDQVRRPGQGRGYVKGFLKYLLTDGQDLAAEVDFAKLPAELQTKALAQLDKIH